MEIKEWEKISRLLESALSLPEAERQAYLVEITSVEGEAVSDEVRALLQADQDSDGFLRTNALGLVAEQLADSAKSAEQIQPNAKYGNYRILARLGEGGMGEVYLALDETLGRKAALKFLPPLFMRDEGRLARFESEARAASALNHPNILTVYEIGAAHGRAFIATEYIEGKTLRDKIAEQNLSQKEILRIAEQVGAALNAAHASGLIHRDIKPENIMLRPDGYVKLLDFGLAKPLRLKEPASSVSTFASAQSQMRRQTQHGQILGTPRYMSPEQARGAQLDGRSDLWSLGATLYEMLTGNALFADAATGQIVVEVGGRAMIELKLNDEQKLFQPMLEKALADDLDQRFQSAGDFLAEVKRVRFALEMNQPSDASRRAKRWALAAAALAVAALIVLAPWRKASLVAPTADTQSSFNRAQVPTEKLYWELSETEKMAFIQDAAHNIAKMLGDDPAASAPEQIAWIKKHVEAYVAKRNSLSIERGEESIKSVYARASVYAPFIIEAFRARSLPPILGLYIAMNETDYHPCMTTAVGAKGLFCFMPQTAVRYGLQLAPEDERCDPHKIAQAAAHYLQDLTRLFGQDADAMTLSMLAYNCGETRVARAIAELKTRNLQPISYWTLLENNTKLSVPLNHESQNYAPRFFAAAILGENPQRFGLEIQRLSAYTTTR